jgi:hypothetical protein
VISAAAVKDINRTPFLPKYSLIMSVMINTTGHNKTPAVKLNERLLSPKNERLIGSMPINFSSENIFTPINSASRAFATKKDPRI